MIDEVENGLLDRPLNLRPVRGVIRQPLDYATDSEAAVEAVEDARVDVGGTVHTCLTASRFARLRPPLVPKSRSRADAARTTAARTVAFPVRKSLALWSSPMTP